MPRKPKVILKSSEEARTYACEMCGRCLSGEETERRLLYFRTQHEQCGDLDARQFWAGHIASLESWLGSAAFERGEFPQGLDELMLELIEWRAALFAFEHVEAKAVPFKTYAFYMQWRMGATYAVLAILGKLVNEHRQDNSLRNLWTVVSPFIRQDGACATAEHDHIDRQIKSRFTNENSAALHFRNTTIAHNEKNTPLRWEEVDADIHILVRVWSVIGAWSSFGLYAPFRSADQAFSGIEAQFDPQELDRLKARRAEYLDLVTQWSLNHLHNGERDPAQGIFRKLVVTSQVVLHL
jgi:hypothetical protein